jgi:hypothetical protein
MLLVIGVSLLTPFQLLEVLILFAIKMVAMLLGLKKKIEPVV